MSGTYSINNPMAPLWLMYPHISRYSIGWRMGYGEAYAMDFVEWYSSLNADEQQQFQQMFPEPKGWLGWYEEETDRDIYDGNMLLWKKEASKANKGFRQTSKEL